MYTHIYGGVVVVIRLLRLGLRLGLYLVRFNVEGCSVLFSGINIMLHYVTLTISRSRREEQLEQ